ncbi:hypothetical protein M422DRAFT_176967, partial [Sphaerobolus stellatus SS14]
SFVVVDNGETNADFGTSASRPVVAAVISLLNDFRLSKGKPPLGFINPWLYSKGFKGLTTLLFARVKGVMEEGLIRQSVGTQLQVYLVSF